MKVLKTFLGEHDLVRTVLVKTQNKTFKRPFVKLYLFVAAYLSLLYLFVFPCVLFASLRASLIKKTVLVIPPQMCNYCNYCTFEGECSTVSKESISTGIKLAFLLRSNKSLYHTVLLNSKLHAFQLMRKPLRVNL